MKKHLIITTLICFLIGYRVKAQCATDALTFDGNSTYVNTNSTSLLNNTSGTIEAWIYPTSYTTSGGGSALTIVSQSCLSATWQTSLVLEAGYLELENYNGTGWNYLQSAGTIP